MLVDKQPKGRSLEYINSNDWGLHGLFELGPAGGTGEQYPHTPSYTWTGHPLLHSLSQTSENDRGKLAIRRAGLGSCQVETCPPETSWPETNRFWSQPSLPWRARPYSQGGVVQRTRHLARKFWRGALGTEELGLLGYTPGETLERMPPAGEGPRSARCAQQRPEAGVCREQAFGEFSKSLPFCCLLRAATSTDVRENPVLRAAQRTRRFPPSRASPVPSPLAARDPPVPPPLPSPSPPRVLPGLRFSALLHQVEPSPPRASPLPPSRELCAGTSQRQEVNRAPGRGEAQDQPGGDGEAAVGAGASAQPAAGPAGTAVVLTVPRGGCRRLPWFFRSF